jgi:hypothetical protein
MLRGFGLLKMQHLREALSCYHKIAAGGTMNNVEALISPADQNPYNPRYIRFDGNIINHEFKTSSIQCSSK